MTTYSSNDYIEARAREYAKRFNRGRSTSNSAAPTVASGAPLIGAPAAPISGDFSQNRGPDDPVSWVLDILSRGAYGSGAVVRSSKDAARALSEGGSIGDAVGTVAQAGSTFLDEFLTPEKRELPSDVVYEEYDARTEAGTERSALQKSDRLLGGLAMDIFADPVTYIPGAAIAKGAQMAGKLPGVRNIPRMTRTQKVAPNAEGMAANAAEGNVPVGASGASSQADIRIPESRQLTEGPRQITSGPRQIEGPSTPFYGNSAGDVARGELPSSAAPKGPFVADATGNVQRGTNSFVADSAGNVERSSLTVSDELLERSIAREADAIAKGTHVPKITPENAAVAKVAKGAENAQDAAITEAQVRKVLVNAKTGKEVPWEQRLANLSSARRTYSDELLDSLPKLYDEIEEAVPPARVSRKAENEARLAAGIDGKGTTPKDIAEQTLGAAHVKPFDAWAKTNRSLKVNIARPGRPADLRTLETLMKHLKSKKPGEAAEAQRALVNVRKNEYMEYARKARAAEAQKATSTPTEVPEPVVKAAEQAARAEEATSRVRYVRKSGEELTRYKEEISRLITDKTTARMLWSAETKTKEGYDNLIARMRAEKTRTPTYVEKIIEETPPQVVEGVDDPIAAVMDEVVPAIQQIQSPPPPPTFDAVRKVQNGSMLSDNAREALNQVFGKKFYANREQWPFVSGRGALRDAELPGVGKAIWEWSYNAKDQYTIASSLVRKYSSAVPHVKGRPLDHAERVYKAVIRDLDQIDTFVRSHGVQAIATDQATGIPLSLGDVLKAMHDSGSQTIRQTVLGRFFTAFGRAPGKGGSNAPGRLDFDSLLMAARTIAEYVPVGTTREELVEALYKSLGAKPGEAAARASKLLKSRGVNTLKKSDEGYKPGPVTPKQADAAVDEVVNALMDQRVMTRIVQAVHDNSAMAGIKFGQDVGLVSRATADDIINALHNPQISIGEAAAFMDNLDDAARNNADTLAPSPLPKNVSDTAAEAVREELSSGALIPIGQVENIERINLVVKAVKADDRAGATQAAYNGYVKNRAQAFAETPTTVLMHSAENTDVAMQHGIFSKLAPMVSKLSDAFIAHSGNATLHTALPVSHTRTMALQKAWRYELNEVHNLIKNGAATQDDLVHAMKVLQGKETNFLPGRESAQQLISERFGPIVSQIFDGGDDAVMGFFFREGFDLKHIMTKFESSAYAIPEKFAFSLDDATQAAKKWAQDQVRQGKYYPSPQEIKAYEKQVLASQWRTWDIDDPVDFMARMEKVAASLATDMSIAQEGFTIAKSLGLASKTPIKGFVKIGNPAESTIARYFPEGYYFDPEIVKEIEKMDDILKQTDSFSSPFGRFVNQYLDPILNMWKSGMTVWRPGHHVRNFVGDSSLSFYADGVMNPRYYETAFRIQHLRRSYDGWDALRALHGKPSRVRDIKTPVATETVATVKIGGKEHKITAEEFNRIMLDEGVLPDFRVQEDLLEAASNPSIAKLQQKMQVTGGKAKEFVGRVSEARDDTVRMAHALHILENPPAGINSMEELWKYTAERVRRYHPDGADLTPFERKYMRRLMPFYSWTRKALPLVIEAMVLQPGRVAMWPKATYNFAAAQGIDLDSMTNPFPEDQLFPSFLTERATGPVYQEGDGSYLSVSPGFAAMDVLNEFAPGPVWDSSSPADAGRKLFGGAIGMLSPMVKGPIEAATETNLATGGRVHDIGEYIDSQIPGVNVASSMSGYSVTGSLLGGTLDPQRSVERGNKGHWDREGLFNYLLGSQVQDMTKPSYQNMAEIQLRDRIGRQIAREQGQ